MSESNGFKLTAVKVARLKKPGRYGDGHGLYLRIAEYPDRNGKPKALAQLGVSLRARRSRALDGFRLAA
jgi:hypothetical protein